MVCENCGANEAVVHLTKIVNNQVSTTHLCQKCAAEKGVEAVGPSPDHPLASFLAQMGEGGAPPADPGAEIECGFCGLTFRGFRDSGRLGCPHCYTAFEVHLRPLLRRIHGSTQHVGKVYLPPDPGATEREKELERLRRRLQRAIDTEDFEQAAQLRDRIRELEAHSAGRAP